MEPLRLRLLLIEDDDVDVLNVKRALPVVLLTTSQDERIKMDAYQLNVAGFLRKPLESAELCQQLEALCRFFSAVEMP